MRVLGVDFGSKRIGIAVGETGHEVASPRQAIRSVQGLAGNARALKTIVQKENADAIALGIPVNVENETMANVCRKLAEELRKADLQVFEVDESLTSFEAEDSIRKLGWTAAKRDRYKDSEAACLILERFFQEHGKG